MKKNNQFYKGNFAERSKKINSSTGLNLKIVTLTTFGPIIDV